MGKVQAVLDDPNELELVAKLAFAQIDTDKNGFIDRRELEALMKKVAQDCRIPIPNSSDVEDAMKAMDTNGDGQLSFDEFKVLVILILRAIAENE